MTRTNGPEFWPCEGKNDLHIKAGRPAQVPATQQMFRRTPREGWVKDGRFCDDCAAYFQQRFEQRGVADKYRVEVYKG